MLFSEKGERLYAVIADGEERHPRALQIAPCFLQLHELHFAVRSPACATVEDDKCAPIATLRLEVQHASGLVR